MPSAYVNKLAKKHHVSIDKAEDMWSKAKASAKKQGKADDYAYITGIFKQMIGESMKPENRVNALIDNVLKGANASKLIEDYDLNKYPGKFEGEPDYTEYFYELMMNGDGEPHYFGEGDEDFADDVFNDTTVEHTQFEITPEDIAKFPELKGHKIVKLYHSDQGFEHIELE